MADVRGGRAAGRAPGTALLRFRERPACHGDQPAARAAGAEDPVPPADPDVG